MGFGFLLGLIFPSFLTKMGFEEKKAYSWIPLISLPFLSFLGYILYPYMVYGSFQIIPIQLFYGAEMFWIAIFLLIGGFINQIYYLLVRKERISGAKTSELFRKSEALMKMRKVFRRKKKEEPKNEIEEKEELVRELQEERVRE